MSAASPPPDRPPAPLANPGRLVNPVQPARSVKVPEKVRPPMGRLAALVPMVWLAGAGTLANAQATAPAAPASAEARTPLAPSASATTAGHCAASEPVAAPAPPDLPGQWQLLLWTREGGGQAPPSTGTIVFEPHPDYPGSVRGTLRRSGSGHDLQAFVSGDLNDGVFSLDESDDGVNMSAVWTGVWPGDACGDEIRGTRRPAGNDPANATAEGKALEFVLRKIPLAR